MIYCDNNYYIYRLLMSRRGKIIFSLIIFLFVGLIGFNILKDIMIKRFFATFELPAVTISTVKAEKRSWQPTISAVGNFNAQFGVDVNSQASGNITDINFQSGQYIKKGETLVTIDDSVEQAQLKFNLAELDLKKLNYSRQEKLYKKGAAPSSSLDEARANLDQAQANVEKIQAQISQKHIQAPFSGRLGIRLINLGEYITPGQTAIVTLQSLDPLYLEFFLPENLIKKVKVNQEILFRVAEFSNMTFKGKISAINAKVDNKTHNIRLQATIPNCPMSELKKPLESKLIHAKKEKSSNHIVISCDSAINQANNVRRYSFIPGMFASIEVIQPTIKNQIILPSSAIAYSLYGDSVYVIKKKPGKEKNSKSELYVKQVFVRTGDQRGNETIILKGIKAGDEVVSSGQLKLQNGTRVKINNSIPMPTTKNIDELGQ